MREFSMVLKKWLESEEGATSIEYVLIAFLMSTAIIALIFAMGDSVDVLYNAVREMVTEYVGKVT